MKIIVKNKKALFDYEIIDRFEAGIILTGAEVKAIREGTVSLKGTYVTHRDTELFVDNMHIGQYSNSATEPANPTRFRKLLLRKKEIIKIINYLGTQGVTAVPTMLYLKNHKVKLEVGIGKGRKKSDKRSLIIERQQKRRVESVMKKY